jgi:hypothetical protein
MVKAVWNGKLIAEADCTEIVGGHPLFSFRITAQGVFPAE